MDARALIQQISRNEPLNPYQIAGLTRVLRQAELDSGQDRSLDVRDLEHVLLILDRTGEEAAQCLVSFSEQDSRITVHPRFRHADLEQMVNLTRFEGRRQAIREYLIPALYEIPNWSEVVSALGRYCLERDDDTLALHHEQVLPVVVNYLFAASLQPFDRQARTDAEHVLVKLPESMLRKASDDTLETYLPYIQDCLSFLLDELFPQSLNPVEYRLLQARSIQAGLQKRSGPIRQRLESTVNRLMARAIVTAFDELEPCPDELLDELRNAVDETDFGGKDVFRTKIIGRISQTSKEETNRRRSKMLDIANGEAPFADAVIQDGINFIKNLPATWRTALTAFQECVDTLPPLVQELFAEILAVQILTIEKRDVKDLLVDGLCRIVVQLEKTKKKASNELVRKFSTLFLDRLEQSDRLSEITSALKALESIGITLGRNGYFLMAQELIDHLTSRSLIHPGEKTFSIEDDDTGEPLVLAEDSRAAAAHVQHVKTIIAITASNPRVMVRLMPYLVVQMEIRGTRLCDEDLIQYSISALLRSNCPITHFLTRTLIKAIPYSFKDIGPLDTLRLTAAGLAKELANRGVKPIGNFLGKLRGDIHWRGSVENFHFCQGILKYLLTGRPEALIEWMPRESMPYLTMDQWCTAEEAERIMSLCGRIFEDHRVDPSDRQGMMPLIRVNTAQYRNDVAYPEFCRKVVLDVIDMLRGLHAKYFVVTQESLDASTAEDLDRLARLIDERITIKDDYLTPDERTPLPVPTTLTEGSADYVRELERIKQEQPETPILARAKKAGHAYAQKATYIEERFEAFNKDIALEAYQETLATSINNTRFDEITLDNLPEALRFLELLTRGTAVNGHAGYYLTEAGSDLKRAGVLELTFDKIRDLLKLLKRELDDIHTFYRKWFEAHFDRCLASAPIEKLPRKLRDLTTLRDIPESDFFRNYLKTLYISDLQARDGNLRVLETFVDKVEVFLNQRLAESGRKVMPSAGESPRPAPFYFPGSEPISACKIGLKAALLRFAENTPPYFVVTTDQPLETAEAMLANGTFRDGLCRAVKRIEDQCGKLFGDGANPALLSVRSGARISMPGMMITITNVGINDEIAAAMAKEVNTWFAYDSYRRFIQEFGQAVFGVAREEFQDIIDERKRRAGVTRKAHMDDAHMKQLAFDYKERLSELAPEAVALIDNGCFMDILVRCAAVVLHSFDGRAARKYRQAAGIDGNWRTPVIVQEMVYGNVDFQTSGTGVTSYNPFTMELSGDFSPGDQGTDVVDGKVSTLPVYDLWKQNECLASRLPDCWKQLSTILFRTAERLHMEVNLEYTIEKGKVYILQIRKTHERRERIPSLETAGYRVIATGTGVSGGMCRGILVTDRNQIAPFRHINKAQSIVDSMNQTLPEGEKLDGFVFIVNDPIPEEIMEEVFSLPVQTALVSRLGGRAAHAADIARSLHKVYVGQVRKIHKFSGRPEVVRFEDRELVVGSKIIIHGQTGEIALHDKAPDTLM